MNFDALEAINNRFGMLGKGYYRTEEHVGQPEGEGKPEQYPEWLIRNGRYKDEGCEVSDSCLTCHLPKCKFELPQNYESEQRNIAIVKDRAAGMKVGDIAKKYGCSTRTVHRACQK